MKLYIQKRGQVTAFVILGIIIVAAVVLIGFLRAKVYLGPVTVEGLSNEAEPIKKHVEKCMSDISDELIKKIALQGGYLEPGEGTYRLHNSIKISYLCFAGENTCNNRGLTKDGIEKQLEDGIKENLADCLNLEAYQKLNYELVYNDINTADVQVDVGEDNTAVSMDYLIKLVKGDTEVEIRDFTARLSYPLGRLFNIAREIINTEASAGEFEQLTYMLYYGQVFNKLLFIEKHEYPYPDRRYELRIDKNDNPFVFEFYIQGKEREGL